MVRPIEFFFAAFHLFFSLKMFDAVAFRLTNGRQHLLTVGARLHRQKRLLTAEF